MRLQEQMNEFKEKYIYSNIYKTEKEEKSYPFFVKYSWIPKLI